MQRIKLGRTGLLIAPIALGAGPVSGLMTGEDEQRHRVVLSRAIEQGINWIDTAPGYGQGRSEANLGRALTGLGMHDRVHLATKVRIDLAQPQSIRKQVERSLASSLERLASPRITLLQLHNGLTRARGEEPASLAPADVLGQNGVLATFEQLRSEGLVDFLGLTGTGHSDALREVIASGAFDTLQVPFHLLNPSAGRAIGAVFSETNYGNIIADCARQAMGVFAIRVFAAGALLGNPPSAHTLVTPYFPLPLYERDTQRAIHLAEQLGGSEALKQLALRYVLQHPHIHAAIIGFATPAQVDEAVAIATEGPLPDKQLAAIERACAGIWGHADAN